MAALDFIFQIGEPGRLQEYLQTLVRILLVEFEDERPWRFSQTAAPDSNDPYFPAKAGYINKLENEGVVERVYDSNSRVTYRLAIPQAKIIEIIARFDDLLDAEHADEYRRLTD